MPAKIEFRGVHAVIEDYEWSCEDEAVLEELTRLTVDEEGPAGSDPDPDATAARFAEREHGAKILWIEDPPDLIEGAIY